MSANAIGERLSHPLVGSLYRCGSCGHVGDNDDLIPDDSPNPHPCGKDECPECGAEGTICCCLSQFAVDLSQTGHDWVYETLAGMDAEKAAVEVASVARLYEIVNRGRPWAASTWRYR